MKFSKVTLAAAVLGAVALPLHAVAQENPWSVRIGATDLVPENRSAPILGLIPANQVDIEKKVIPEIDLLYSFTPNLVGELVATYPQQHNVTVGALGNIGTLTELPPTLLLQWHFLPAQTFDPYVGVGVNWTWITPVKLTALNQRLDTTRSSWGVAAQIGADYNLDKQWYLNVDVKYVTINADIYAANGTKISDVFVNPMLYSVGVGYRF